MYVTNSYILLYDMIYTRFSAECDNSWILYYKIYILVKLMNHWGDQDVDGMIILRWILRKWEGAVGTGWSWLMIGTGGGPL